MKYDRKLILEDGSVYPGIGFGAGGTVVCEVVFNTSQVGYQEILSDPSYTDQAVVMTYPLIGNYGLADEDYESKMTGPSALIVRDINEMPSNFRSTRSVPEFLMETGTPGISDPGFMLVRECVRNGIEVQTLPGATAFVPALVSSGLPCDKFVFEGFLPQKKGRQKRLGELKNENRTIVFYESPYRVVKTLEQFAEVFGAERPVSCCREISKLHEESVRGTIAEVLQHFKEHEPKGEFVIVLGAKEE